MSTHKMFRRRNKKKKIIEYLLFSGAINTLSIDTAQICSWTAVHK